MRNPSGGIHPGNRAISRRRLLQFGAPALGLGLADLLPARAGAEAPGDPPRSSPRRPPLIVFWTPGGLSHRDTYALKPDGPPQFRGPYPPIPTSAPGIFIPERFPRQARVMHRLSLVRS